MTNVYQIPTNMIDGLDTTIGNTVTKNGNETLSGEKTFSKPISSSVNTNTYLKGNQGTACINSTVGAGAYVALFKSNSTNGYFTLSSYTNALRLYYTAKTTVDAGNNSTTYGISLLDESGNTSFPGTVTAPLVAASNSTSLTSLVNAGWVNDPSKSTNVVHRSGNETIAGEKTFSDNICLQRSIVQPIFKSTGYEKGTAPTGDTYMCHKRYHDKNGNSVFNEYYYIPGNSNKPRYILRFYNVSSASATGYKDIITAEFDGTNSAYVIDATTATAPTPSTSDNSTKIATTAFVKAQNYALDSNTVHKSGNETITGAKTFSNTNPTVNVKCTNINTTSAPTSAEYGGIQFNDNNGTRICKIEPFHEKNDNISCNFNVSRTINDTVTYATFKISIDSSGNKKAKLFDKEIASFVTETYKNGDNWYRVWSDGWIEQGGITEAWLRGSTNTLTFIKPFTQRPTFLYDLETTYGEASEMRAIVGDQNNNQNVRFVTTTQATIYIHGMSGSGNDGGPVHWVAYGY